jgi:hypothetical protein
MGRLDWAKFRHLGDLFLWAVFPIKTVGQNFGLLFHGRDNALNLPKIWVTLHFHMLIWSRWSSQTPGGEPLHCIYVSNLNFVETKL